MWTPEQRAMVGPAVKHKISSFNEIARARGQTLPQMALAWILRRPEVTSVLIGASDVSQVEENVKALANLNFSDEELRQIDQICAS
jgi:L-glyceraldehyde 3-phosphate reductase